MMDLFTYRKEILPIMETVGIHKDQKYTIAQIKEHVKKYVSVKKLLNPEDPFVITMGDDPISHFFRPSSINLRDPLQRNELVLMLFKIIEPCRPNTVPVTQLGQTVMQGVKRKYVEECASPMYLRIPPSPQYDSSEETAWSLQEYSTEEARNSGSCSDDDSEPMFTSDVLFTIPSSSSAIPTALQACSSKQFQVFTKYCTKQTKIKGESGSDVPFWGDQELSDDSRKGNMTGTGLISQKPCMRKQRRFSKRQRHKMKQLQDLERVDSSKSSQGSCSTKEAEEEQDKCIICVSRDANALILHGRTAHAVCCYRCARKLQNVKQSNTCPACRRDIDRVVRLL